MGLANVAYVGQGGKVAALDVADGSIRWSWSAPKPAGRWTAHPARVQTLRLDGERLLVGWAGELFCLDAASGRLLWHNSLPGMFGIAPVVVLGPRG